MQRSTVRICLTQWSCSSMLALENWSMHKTSPIKQKLRVTESQENVSYIYRISKYSIARGHKTSLGYRNTISVCFIYFKERVYVTVKLDCQFDWLQKHLGVRKEHFWECLGGSLASSFPGLFPALLRCHVWRSFTPTMLFCNSAPAWKSLSNGLNPVKLRQMRTSPPSSSRRQVLCAHNWKLTSTTHPWWHLCFILNSARVHLISGVANSSTLNNTLSWLWMRNKCLPYNKTPVIRGLFQRYSNWLNINQVGHVISTTESQESIVKSVLENLGKEVIQDWILVAENQMHAMQEQHFLIPKMHGSMLMYRLLFLRLGEKSKFM